MESSGATTMKHRIAVPIPEAITQLQRQLEQFRSSRPGRKKLPESFWQAAVDLARQVDARPEEQAMSWYYYLEGKITFPFRAKCIAANAVSPLRKGETVEVLRMAAEGACDHDMLVQIRWQKRKMPFLFPNSKPSIRTNPPRKPSATVFRFSWKWRRRSPIKLMERTHEEATEA